MSTRAKQPVNAELLAEIRKARIMLDGVGHHVDEAILVDKIDTILKNAIARAESVEKAPALDTKLIASAVLQMAPQPPPIDAWPSYGSEWMKSYRAWWIDRLRATGIAPAQPNVVSGLVAALRKIRDYQTFSPAGVAKDALAAFEAQGKAEPKT